MLELTEIDKEKCPGCGSVLVMPYVQCTECGLPPVDICLHCFARGVEMGHHHSNHKYKVIVSVRVICFDYVFYEENCSFQYMFWGAI